MRKSLLLALCPLILISSIRMAQATGPRPNFVFVLGDDMRFDSYGSTGGPDWFHCPSIDRIAKEGVSFTNFFCVYSLCVPSRASMITSLYPHNNGAYNNSSKNDPSLPTIAAIMQSAGYHTAFIGKYHIYSAPQPGWDYWFAISGNINYNHPRFNRNGVLINYDENVTKVINDTSLQIVSTIDTPFVVFVWHLVAHRPITPLPENVDTFKNQVMPFPSNFYKYSTDFLSLLYSRDFYTDSSMVDSDYLSYFQGILGIDQNIGDLFGALSSRHLLRNTMLMFSSDNGYIFGEHKIAGKVLPNEESIKLPLFIRYPPWFNKHTVLSNEIALMIDIAPTMLDAAGIDAAPYNFQGMSLHHLANGSDHRSLMLFEKIRLANASGEDNTVPSFRGVRSLYFKYTRYQCTAQTEDFYDLVNDPHENVNAINDPDYTDIVQSYRNKLDSMLIVFHDTLSVDSFYERCFLYPHRPELQIFQYELDSLNLKTEADVINSMDNTPMMQIENLHLYIFNMLGQLVVKQKKPDGDRTYEYLLTDPNLPKGIYYVVMTDGITCQRKVLVKGT